MMRELLDFIVTERTENHARVLLTPREGSGIRKIAGVVRGPYSDFSKTLTADSVLRPTAQASPCEALVTEPCYWTPRLPFWYDLRLAATFENGESREEIIPVGLKRFYCERGSFLLEGKRVVLRGMKFDELTAENLDSARKYETALIVKRASGEILERSSRLGVPLVVDLRHMESLEEVTGLLNWYPAVMLLMMNQGQLSSLSRLSMPKAVCVDAAEVPSTACDVYAVELPTGERPPAWVATCDKPVIVVRNDPEAEIGTARAGCDKLQAELAPEFDLAGYFV